LMAFDFLIEGELKVGENIRHAAPADPLGFRRRILIDVFCGSVPHLEIMATFAKCRHTVIPWIPSTSPD